jgi:predicted nucleic acid-binding protein
MKVLISDTSVLLNLLASGCIEYIAKEISCQFAICTVVRDEVKKLRNPDTGKLEPVDITPLIDSGFLTILDVEHENEKTLYIDQATVVDDGEAMSLAIAIHRNLELAMDDRQATNYSRRQFPSLKIWTTPDILKSWADTTQLAPRQLSEAIRLIEARARYIPHKKHHLSAWWEMVKR